MAKKQVYLQLVIQRFQETRQRIAQVSEGVIPAAVLKKNLEAQQARTLAEEERVDGLLRDLPVGDEYLLVRRALNDERSNLVNLQNDVALRIRSMGNIEKTQEAIQASTSRDSLSQELDDILKIWEEELAGTVRQRPKWADLYRAMERSLEPKEPAEKGSTGQGGGSKAPKKTKSKGESGPAPAVVPRAAAAQAGTPSSTAAGLAGAWVYRSQPGAWTGYGEPQAVTLELHQEGGEWIGAYTARLPVRSGIHDIRLVLAGASQPGRSARLRWKSETPAAEGEMEISLSGDGRLLVERALSNDSYIPRGMEVLLAR